ncbi:hypothetical protein FVEN_g6598 [Fusarium venenatum]|uniref:SPX domain-containing protein n=2 Tax=Fusarium venenatum TaxID=56646 RepID=A0A2L2T8D9_9HYPO|nr:uncharacterized protein FVRRES_04903 [Fusarium venenatum]KAG8355571.1 hypothetical protein FVEN_g6598 [Fusarium venenatum]CEI60467.1 unnamed protein product [Fusarium venenatum]
MNFHERNQVSGNTTGQQTPAMEVTIPASFKSRHHLKKTQEKILTNIKVKREDFRTMEAKDIQQRTKDLDETSRKSKVAVEKMSDAITLFYDDRVENLYQKRKAAYDSLEGQEDYKLKHFLVTLRYSVGLRVWWMNQRKYAKIQELQDAVDKLKMSCFMARLTDGGKEPNNVFTFA